MLQFGAYRRGAHLPLGGREPQPEGV